jgi:hypothetical protein
MGKPSKPGTTTPSQTTVPAAQVMSFLRDVHSSLTWTEQDFAELMNVSKDQTKAALGMLQLAGYVEPVEKPRWRTTDQGRQIAGGKTPRFTSESMEKALGELQERITLLNSDQSVTYRVTRAVAFGDFLGDRVRVQAAEVGIELQPRASGETDKRESVTSRSQEKALLKRLQGHSTPLRVQQYEPWMSNRSHRDLM